MTDPKSEREQSDLFSLRQTGKTSIPPVAEVLTPPEELRKQRVRRTVAAVVAVVLVLITSYTVYHFVHQASVQSSALRAGDTGRVADVEDAIDTVGSESPGLTARLHAILALGGSLSIEEAQASLEAVPDDEDEASERYKAETYLALARGDVAAAAQASSRLIPAGTFAAETAYAKSLSALANGDLATAVRDARAAVSVEEHANAPRYIGQLAVALDLSGDSEGALSALGNVGDDVPIRLARARIRARARRDDAAEDAEAVLASDLAHPAEKGWAHLVIADGHARRGDRAQARTTATAARESMPPGDALFRWRLAKVLLTADAVDEAVAVLDGLSGPVADAALAGRVNAELQIKRGQATEALASLQAVPASPAAWLLVGTAQQLQGNLDEARGYFDRAAGDSAYAAEGFAARAALELAAEQPADAERFARQGLEAAPHHPAIVPIAVAALLAQENADDALGLASSALEAHQGDVRLLSSLADAQLAKEDYAGALTSARAAAEQLPNDADLQAKRGEAARGQGEGPEAREAYEKALEIEAAHPVALVGLLHLDVEEGNVEHAKAIIERIRAARINTAEVVLLRVRYLVASGAGVAGTRYTLQATRRRDLRRSGFLRRAMAELYLQGELYRPAAGMFDQAVRFGENRVDMLLGRAMAHAMDRKTNLANTSLQEALEAALPEDAPEGTTSPAAEHPRLLAVRARMELNLGRFASAQRYAERSIASDADNREAQLVIAEVAMRQRRSATEALQTSLLPPNPQPIAAALLARRLGLTAEGCAYARRYLEVANRRGLHFDAMEDFVERCGD
ncbi:MAG: tetratricopeptide repeat protein [Myxococcota bacterium]